MATIDKLKGNKCIYCGSDIEDDYQLCEECARMYHQGRRYRAKDNRASRFSTVSVLWAIMGLFWFVCTTLCGIVCIGDMLGADAPISRIFFVVLMFTISILTVGIDMFRFSSECAKKYRDSNK
jgi:predicted nucleic acid-binding Zn ribbon protein